MPMEISRHLGLIGYPISKSRSPELFYKYFKKTTPFLAQCDYSLMEYPSFEYPFSLFKRDFLAVNVTAPFKETAAERADLLSEEVSLTGASNLLIHNPVTGKVEAYNTDCYAVRQIVTELAVQHSDRVVVLGAGGAGKAAVAAVLSLGMRCILLNRTFHRAQEYSLALRKNSRWGDNLSVAPWEDLGKVLDSGDIVIYALPVRVFPELKSLRGKRVIEALYSPGVFSDEEEAENNMKICRGERWLMLQAEETYRIISERVRSF